MWDNSRTLITVDEMDLNKICVPDMPKDIIFPDELNKFLRDQIQYLNHENGMLRKNLSENELQLKQSESRLESLSKQVGDCGNLYPKNGQLLSATTLASSKIVELSKKLRERNSELEVLKTKYSKLEQHLWQREQKEEVSNARSEDTETENLSNNLGEEVKNLTEKLSTTTTRLFETRNANMQLKNDLKLANKVLQQEIGEKFETIQNLATSNSNWRGRAQVICDLQQKNNELREKLKAVQEKSTTLNTNAESVCQTKQEKRIELLSKENLDLKNAWQESKKKLEVVKARCKVYDSECSTLRAKLSAVTDANERNHELITILTAKVATCQDSRNDVLKQKQAELQKMEQQNKNLEMELAKEKCKSENIRNELQATVTEMQNMKNNFHGNCINSSTSCVSIDISQKVLNRLEAERIRLLELTEVANTRLEEERNSHSNTQAHFRQERQRAAKLEAKLARLQLEQCTDRSGNSYTSSRCKNKERSLQDRLELAEETVKALQTRLTIQQQERKSDIKNFASILQNCSESSGTFG